MISEPVRKLIADHIDSVEQLEVLILLRSRRDRSWTIDEVNNQLKSSASSVEARLRNLAARGFLQQGDGAFRYGAAADLDGTVAELARVYGERRFTVIELIFSRPTDTLRAFADAFKVSSKKRGSDG